MSNDKLDPTFNGSPLVTIISSTLNCSVLLNKTILSIRNQTYQNIQWIVADGGSTDGTVDLIKQTDAVSDWFSSRDRGIYDAWNKAIPLIRGEWIIFLGAGDIFANSQTLTNAVQLLLDVPPGVGLAYGNVVQKLADKEIYRYGYIDLTEWECFRPKLPAHQGVFHCSSLFRNQSFDSSYRVVADSKFMFEALKNTRELYLNIDICFMEPGGVSSHPKFALRVMKEFFRLEREMAYKIPLFKRMEYIARVYGKMVIYLVKRFMINLKMKAR